MSQDLVSSEHEAVLALLVHTAAADRDLSESEMGFLTRLLPGRDAEALRAWVLRVTQVPLDMEAVGQALPTPESRWTALRFVARMAFADGVVAADERALLVALAAALGLPGHAVDVVLSDHLARVVDEVDLERVSRAFEGFPWSSVELVPAEMMDATLGALVPEGAEPFFGVRLDDADVLSFFKQGLAAWFQEGPVWLPWRDIVAWSRVPSFGAALVLHTVDGRRFTLIDARLGGLAGLLQRIFGGDRAPRTDPPAITRIRAR
jgi:hypothetical protein